MRRPLFAALLILSACQGGQIGSTEAGAVGGAAAGAGLGAIIGHQTGNTGAGVAIGAAAGALGGALIGSQLDRENRRLDNQDALIAQQGAVLEENRRLLEELRAKGVDVRDSPRGVVINLPDVLFQFGKAVLTPAALATIREITAALQNAPSRQLSVEGHTDSIGTIEYNYRLSDARARSVADSLADNGIAPRRIQLRALGETDPIASNRTEDGRRRNRRVEVVILNPG